MVNILGNLLTITEQIPIVLTNLKSREIIPCVRGIMNLIIVKLKYVAANERDTEEKNLKRFISNRFKKSLNKNRLFNNDAVGLLVNEAFAVLYS